MTVQRSDIAILAIGLSLSLGASSSHAACPMILATYEGRDGSIALEFRPVADSFTVTNSFRLVAGDVAMDGIVMWTAGISRSWGVLMDDCPQGDLTGEEISECTVWEGVVYALDNKGEVGLLPAEGESAPPTLILADLGARLAQSDAWSQTSPVSEPWDVFKLSGCQE